MIFHRYAMYILAKLTSLQLKYGIGDTILYKRRTLVHHRM